MAKQPSKTSGTRISNMMDQLRGGFNFTTKKEVEVGPSTRKVGGTEIISASLKNRILISGQHQETAKRQGRGVPINAITNLASSSYARVGQDRAENRRILQLMPEVGKAARLMVASIFSPNDLSRHEIAIRFEKEGVHDTIQTQLGELATKFFQRKLNLKTAAPKWVYQFGYESGAAIFAVVPMTAFDKLQASDELATEAFAEKVVDPVALESLFGFGDTRAFKREGSLDVAALESFSMGAIKDYAASVPASKDKNVDDDVLKRLSKDLLEKFIGQESLNLTDNPSVLQVTRHFGDQRKRKTKQAINQRYKQALHEPLAELDSEALKEGVIGNPMLVKLPPESVTVIHTPGEPADHQGYLVLLDIAGNPISINTQIEDDEDQNSTLERRRSDVFSQVHQAYGMGGSTRTVVEKQTTRQLYSQVVTRHLYKRLGKAGFGHVEIPNLDATMRHMFSRLLQEKRTRILFLPKELVTYMTFEVDENGYGVSKLNSIKFALAMKMSLQVSRVLAAIKAAMDKRNINMKFDENNMEQPEAMIENVIQAFIQKNGMTFSTDPGLMQSQIQQKSFTVKTQGIPGMDFEITNEPDNKSGSIAIDQDTFDYLDKQIINGLDVPASTMNSLNDDEYARSVTTTNLFFAMEVAIHQDTAIGHISDVLRKYALYSQEFQKEVFDLLPELNRKRKGGIKDSSSTDETNVDSNSKGDDSDIKLPEDVTFEDLIEAMMISLPKPNIAPSKTQFESMEAMTQAMTNMMGAWLPDDLAGGNDSLRQIIALLRARFVQINIKSYMENVGMSGLDVPDIKGFSSQFTDLSSLQRGLLSVQKMLEDQTKLTTPVEQDPSVPPGY